MSRKSNTAQRRAQITEGLLQVVAQKGYAQATIQAIAGAVGLTPGLIHYHFKTKQEILTRLMEELFEHAEDRYRRRLETATDAQMRLKAFIDAQLALGEDARPEAVRAWVVLSSEAIRSEEVRVLFSEMAKKRLSELERLISDALKESKKETEETSKIALGLLALIEGAYTLSASTQDVLPSGFAAETAWQMAQAMIKKTPTG